MRVPKEFLDFSMWLAPENLSLFKKWEILNLTRKVLRTKVCPLSYETQIALSKGLQNNPQDFGSFALRVYYYQIMKGDTFSLDLRPSRFSFHRRHHFEGEKLAFTFTHKMLSALQEVYRIYYSDEEKSLIPYLEQMGLLQSSWTKEEKKNLENLFLNHFNYSLEKGQSFKTSDLFKSFSHIFFFIKSNKGIVPSEFAFLGICLTSLYLSLEKVPRSLNVKECLNAPAK